MGTAVPSRPRPGRVPLWGRALPAKNPGVRARLGLGRTFQRMELCHALTVRENIALGRESRVAGGGVLRQIFATPDQRRVVAEATDDALESCDLGGLSDRLGRTLSPRPRRLLELAPVLARGCPLPLLGQP